MEEKLKELKARAYDLIALKEQAQIELNGVNQEIAVLSNKLKDNKE